MRACDEVQHGGVGDVGGDALGVTEALCRDDAGKRWSVERRGHRHRVPSPPVTCLDDRCLGPCAEQRVYVVRRQCQENAYYQREKRVLGLGRIGLDGSQEVRLGNELGSANPSP
jgi:hypothetical protein